VFLGVAAAMVAFYFAVIFPDLDDDPGVPVDTPVEVALGADGVVLVADAGSGENDGRVVAVDPESGDRTLVIEGLPSQGDEDAPGGAIGVVDVGLGSDGRVCALIGRPAPSLRCDDGSVVGLDLTEPSALASDGDGGWYIADAATDRVLRLVGTDLSLVVELTSLFEGSNISNSIDLPVRPVGLAVSEDGRLAVALAAGATVELTFGADATRAAILPATGAIDVFYAGATLYVLHVESDTEPARISSSGLILAEQLDEPGGLVRLPDGRFAVAEPADGEVRLVEPEIGRDAPGGSGGGQ
jgi:hypothetical protein